MTPIRALRRVDLAHNLPVIGRRLPVAASALLVAAIAWQLAGLTWTVAAGPQARTDEAIAPPAGGEAGGDESIDVERIVAARLFGRAEPGAGPAPIDAPETRLNLSLRGVIAGADASSGMAIITDAQGRERLYRVTEPLPGGARLHAVHSNQVLLERNGALETLRLPREEPGLTLRPDDAPARRRGEAPAAQPLPAPEETGGQAETRSPARPAEPSGLADAFRIEPQVEPDGRMRGYRVYPAGDRRPFAALGLESGDLITALNGVALSDPIRAMEVFAELEGATRVEITVERDGEQQNMTLDERMLVGETGAVQ